MPTAARGYRNVFGDFSVSCGVAGFALPSVLRDEPADPDQVSLSDYFTFTYEKFSARLEKFKNLSRASNVTEERELVSLLETLISTKEMIQIKKGIRRRE